MTPKGYLPGGLMSAFYGKCRSLMQGEKTKIGQLGNWMTIVLDHDNKKLVIINTRRMLRTSSNVK